MLFFCLAHVGRVLLLPNGRVLFVSERLFTNKQKQYRLDQEKLVFQSPNFVTIIKISYLLRVTVLHTYMFSCYLKITRWHLGQQRGRFSNVMFRCKIKRILRNVKCRHATAEAPRVTLKKKKKIVLTAIILKCYLHGAIYWNVWPATWSICTMLRSATFITELE